MNAEKKRRIVVTSALPYANGDIHLGHLVEYLQTDFWVRFQKMRGHECVYVCADDTHGTPIMVRARKEGITPEELIATSHAKHTADFADFQIAFDNYYTTNSPENRAFCEAFFPRLESAGHIASEMVPQLYCEKDQMFLPDRFVRGTCPFCGAQNQYGDSCDACGHTYSTADLKDPHCAVCGGTPVLKSSEHLLFELDHFHEYLREWLPQHTSQDVANKLLEWFDEPLKSWDISRDGPYFGFPIPGHPGKFFYVWLDAPVGYLASLRNWCEKNGRDFEDYWNNPAVERYHFIGKDIVRFHCLFWPSILHAAGQLGPDKVFVHGFLTVDGEKMSKSKGTFIKARTYLDHLDPAFLRYYYACKLGGTTDDLDLSLDDFALRVNSELVGKITNLASRGAQMLHKRLDGRMGEMDDAFRAELEHARSRADAIAEAYENRDFAKVVVEVRDLADRANQLFDAAAPWKTIKTDPETARKTLTGTLHLFRAMAIYLKPVLPEYAKKVEALFGEEPFSWDSLGATLENRPVGTYEYLAQRIEPEKIQAMIDASKETLGGTAAAPAAAPVEPVRDIIEFPDFEKIDLRVARVLEAGPVEGSDKLVRFKLLLGPLGERQIFSGIRAAYPDPSVLVGKDIVIVANLKPRKMRFGVSEGMVLSAGPADDVSRVRVLTPLDGAAPGDPVA